MVFNPCSSIDFSPEFSLENNDLEVVDEMRLLGIVIKSDLKWTANTENMVQKANKRIWILRRLDVYIKQIRSVLELAVPVWHCRINQTLRESRRVLVTLSWVKPLSHTKMH